MREMNSEEVKREREKYKRESIGPVGSSLMVLPQPQVFFKVRWTDDLKRVGELAQADDIDCYTRWVVLAAPESVALALEIGWPDAGVNVCLYFEIEKWRTELGLLRDGGTGLVMLSPEGVKGMKGLTGSIAVEAGSDLSLIDTALTAHQARTRARNG